MQRGADITGFNNMPCFSERNMVFRVQPVSIGMKISMFVTGRRKNGSYETVNSIISCNRRPEKIILLLIRRDPQESVQDVKRGSIG